MLSPLDEVQDALNRYLQLCDVPAPADLEDGPAELFTEDAVWEGAGPEYSAKFGRTRGRAAIADMLAAYLPPNPYFKSNVHLLFPGTIVAHENVARYPTVQGRWLMQQLSRYDSGLGEMMVARLDVTFRLLPEGPRISVFRTQRLFSSPLPGQPCSTRK